MSDELLDKVADYVANAAIDSEEAYETARLCLADSMGCALLSLSFPACKKLLGPIVPGTIVPCAAKVPGTAYALDPILAAFNIGLMIRWLDYNDTWLAAEWGHPSDNLGGLLAIADFLSRKRVKEGKQPLKVRDLLTAMIKAYEIQGILALKNSFNKRGFDHVILVKAATAAVSCHLMGGSLSQIKDALSQAWIDTGPLRCYRHAPMTGSRKSWAAGDATSRGLFLAHLTMRGEMGYPLALSAPKWGFQSVVMQGEPLVLERPLGSYVMENILFKISYPAEFHAQTAVEAAVALHPIVKDRIEDIARIFVETHASAVRIIDKKGPLKNPADRDHCLQYMIAIGLLKGGLAAGDYEEEASCDGRIDALRVLMEVTEYPPFSADYLDPKKRSIANALTIVFKNGTATERLVVEYPLGHRRRRSEALSPLFEKLERNIGSCFSNERTKELIALFQDHEKLSDLAVDRLMDLLAADR